MNMEATFSVLCVSLILIHAGIFGLDTNDTSRYPIILIPTADRESSALEGNTSSESPSSDNTTLASITNYTKLYYTDSKDLQTTENLDTQSLKTTTITPTTTTLFDESLITSTASPVTSASQNTPLHETSVSSSFSISSTSVARTSPTSERAVSSTAMGSSTDSIKASSVSTKRTNMSTFNHTENSIGVTTNIRAMTSDDTNTVPTKITTDPFYNNTPINFHRSTTEPIENTTFERQKQTSSINDFDDYGDTFWPVAMALTIGVPTIIVLGITITVLYRRRMHKRKGLLGMYGTDYQNM